MHMQPGIIHNHTPNCGTVFWAWMTSQRNVALICKLHGSLTYLTCILTLSMGVCTTRHCQTSSRLVQKLNVCTAVKGGREGGNKNRQAVHFTLSSIHNYISLLISMKCTSSAPPPHFLWIDIQHIFGNKVNKTDKWNVNVCPSHSRNK